MVKNARVPSLVSAVAQVVNYRCEHLRFFDDEAAMAHTPPINAMFSFMSLKPAPTAPSRGRWMCSTLPPAMTL